MTINTLNIIGKWHILASLYAFKIVKIIIANFLHASLLQFMKSSIISDMFGKILVFGVLN